MNLSKLKEPFPAEHIKWRVGRAGTTANGKVWAKVLAYVDARAIYNRLDELFGADGWTTRYDRVQDGWLCQLGISINGKIIIKQDGSDETDIEGFKGGISKALVRAASAWGMGRYLYDLPEGFATILDKKEPGCYYQPAGKNNPAFYWKPPQLPSEFLPKQEKKKNTKGKKSAPAAPSDKPESNEDTALRDLTVIMKQNKWTPPQVNEYIKRRFSADSARVLYNNNPDHLETIVSVVKELSFDEAVEALG